MSADWTLRNECHCGHHKDTHHEGKHACLGMYCECIQFVKDDQPLPLPVRVAPKAYTPVDDESAPDTPRMPGWPWSGP